MEKICNSKGVWIVCQKLLLLRRASSSENSVAFGKATEPFNNSLQTEIARELWLFIEGIVCWKKPAKS